MSDQKTPESAFMQALNVLRGEIDGIDDKIIALLKDRSAIVQKVGALKAQETPGRCPVRAGREAQQLRRVVEAFKDSPFQPAAAAAMWRMIIMASLAIEGEIKISVCVPDRSRSEYFWLAREYFGPFATFIRQPTPKRVMGDLIDGKAQVGVLPPFTEQSQGRWWTDIPGKDEGSKPKVFALLPFVHMNKPTPDTPTAVAVGLVEPEETGDDLSYLFIEVDEMVSHSKLQTVFAQVKLEARWLEVMTQIPGKRHHLVEVKGFITPEHEQYKAFCAAMNNTIISTSFLGAAASPVILNHQPQPSHAQLAHA